MKIKRFALMASLALLMWTAARGRAQVPVTLNTAPLNGQGTFFLDFQLLDGAGSLGRLKIGIKTVDLFA